MHKGVAARLAKGHPCKGELNRAAGAVARA